MRMESLSDRSVRIEERPSVLPLDRPLLGSKSLALLEIQFLLQ